jgi:TolA-binding protein
MAQKDGIIRNLEHQLRERDQEIERLTSATQQEPQDLQKMKELEMKVVEMESMIKGLTEELLDLKSVVRNLVRVHEERRVRERPPVATVTIAKEDPEPVEEPSTEVQPAEEAPEASLEEGEAEAKSAPANVPADWQETVMIMQADGTLKPEQRHAEGMIIASNRPGFPQKKSSGPSSEKIIIGKREMKGESSSKAPLIYAEDEDKS